MVAAAEQRDVEFVHDVTSGLPTRVIGELMGLPEADWPLIHRLAEKQTSGQDAEVVGDDSTGLIDMAMYAIEFAGQRRPEPPREDLTTLILEADFGGRPMTDVDFGSFFVQLVTAGNDTTKTMLSSGLHALLTHPDQLADLRADRSLIAGAVEEILRWANPLHYFRRTTTEDTVLHGIELPVGTKVAMYYTSANRDEAVFADASASTSTGRPTRTCPSASPNTSVSASTSPASRAASSSRSCSPRSPASSSRATRCTYGPTSTTRTSAFPSG